MMESQIEGVQTILKTYSGPLAASRYCGRRGSPSAREESQSLRIAPPMNRHQGGLRRKLTC